MTDDWVLLALRVVAAGLLYAFLAVVVYAVWRDMRATVAPRRGHASDADGAAPTGRLSVSTATDSPLAAGRAFAVVPPATLGRDDDNQIVLPDACVSARHALIVREQGEWILADLGSRNGTRLNDLPITKPTLLTHGDVIGIGGLELRFESVSGDAAGREPEK
jgi:hypothetical protein